MTSQKLNDSVVQSAQNSAGMRDGAEAFAAMIPRPSIVERLGWHHEDQVTGDMVLRNPDGPEAARAIEELLKALNAARNTLAGCGMPKIAERICAATIAKVQS